MFRVWVRVKVRVWVRVRFVTIYGGTLISYTKRWSG